MNIGLNRAISVYFRIFAAFTIAQPPAST